MAVFKTALILCLVQATVQLSNAATIKHQAVLYSSSSVQCYDCNYDPKGGNPQAGYSRCGLLSAEDADGVDKWSCPATQCFIRKDPNGLVYRGCADPSALPLGVDVSSNTCEPQGPDKSYWKFCEGDLCNDGDVGCETGNDDADDENEVDVHGYGVDEGGYDVDNTGYGADNNGGYDVSNTGYDVNDNGYYISQQGYGYGVEAREGPRDDSSAYGMYPSNDRYYPDGYRGQYSADSGNMMAEPEKYAREEAGNQKENRNSYGEDDDTPAYNPCDGKCGDNPSGLFADPSRTDRFIQCGVSDEATKDCHCCKMFYVNCPDSTRFDDVTKVCVGHEMYRQIHASGAGPSEH